MKDGIIIINKSQNMTSFDVVAILRKTLGIKRIGHLGTLDPMATGVLPIALGSAARIMDYLDSDIKEYIAEIRFGITTETDDIWGDVIFDRTKELGDYLSTDDNKETFRESIIAKAKDFTGVIDQIPPKYAAIKVDGRKLYQYARSGEEVEIKSRRMYVESIDVMNIVLDNNTHNNIGLENSDSVNSASAILKIRCSKGTYIRSIARDLGEKLGFGGCMSGLIRTSSGVFKLGSSVKIEDIRDTLDSFDGDTESEGFMKYIDQIIMPIDSALGHFPYTVLGEWESKLFSSGVVLRPEQWSKTNVDGSTNGITGFPLELPDYYEKAYRVYRKAGTSQKEFLGIGLKREDGTLKAHKVFNRNN